MAESSKAVGYLVISPPNDGPVASKAVGYLVLSTEVTVAASKALGYLVLEDAPPAVEIKQPVAFICC
jgi:hypothetical protein